jgi:hypothetical protein
MLKPGGQDSIDATISHWAVFITWDTNSLVKMLILFGDLVGLKYRV